MKRGPVGVPWFMWAVLAFAVAAVFTIVTPGAAEASGPEHLVLRWFHALVWVLLGLSAVLRGFATPRERYADVLAGLALVTYLIYVVTFVLNA